MAKSDSPAPKSLDPAVQDALSQLSPDEAMQVLDILERGLKRRKIQLWGYLVAALVLIVGTLGCLYYTGIQEQGSFVAWVFMLPMASVALVFILLGRWAEKYRTEIDDRMEANQKKRSKSARK